jgi:protein-S-isoprenylcysteine O-methyltransferase Ste14
MDQPLPTAVRNRRFNLDLLEKIGLGALLAFAAARFIPATITDGNLLNLVLLASESLVVLLIIFRRSTHWISRRPADWAAAILGTSLPLLTIPAGASGGGLVPLGVSGALMLFGLCLHLSAKLILLRSFGVVAANRGVKTFGPYRLVRHPMYAGYVIVHIGFLLAAPSLWNLGLLSATFVVMLYRISAEERVLMHDPAYREFTQKVRYRLLPLVY